MADLAPNPDRPGLRQAPFPALLGIRNTERPERLPLGALSAAVNVDHDDTGAVEIRQGYAKRMDFSACTSAFASKDEQRIFVLDGGTILVSEDAQTAFPVVSGLADEVLAWADSGERVAYAGEHDLGFIVDGRHAVPGRIPTPLPPKLYQASGNLPIGVYQFFSIYRNCDTGIEGGCGPAAMIELTEPGGIFVEAPVLAGHSTVIYATETSGSTPLLWRVDSGKFDEDEMDGLGAPMNQAQWLKDPMPTGITALAFHEGALWAATYIQEDDMGVVWFSQPFFHHLVSLDSDFLLAKGKVLAMAATPSGLLIATTRSVFLYASDSLQTLLEFGAVEGYPIAQDRQGMAAIWTQRGAYLFPPLTPITPEKLSVPPGSRCSTAFVEKKGRKQFIAIVNSDGPANNPY